MIPQRPGAARTDPTAHILPGGVLDTDRELEIARCLFRESSDGLFIVDPVTRLVVDLNPAALRLSGLTRKETLSLRIDDLFTGQSDGLRRMEEALEKTGQFLPAEDFFLTRSAGERVPVNVSVSRIHTKPDPLGLVVARDVSARRRAEEVLGLFFRLSPALFAVTDVGGGFVRFNPAWTATLGFDAESLREAGLFGLVHPDDRQAMREAFGSLSAGELSGFEVRFRHKDGTDRWLSWSALATGGRVYAVATDVTGRQQVEALQLAKEAAELASRAKDRFLAVLSHELRTPLTPILLGVVEQLADPALPEAVRPLLEIVHRNVAIEARLVDDLLDLARATQSTLRLELQPLDAHETLRQSLTLFETEASAAGVRLIDALIASEHHVEADPERLRQAVWNLIQNALRFTPRGGTVTVRSRNEPPIGAVPGIAILAVDVTDTGVGIDPEQLPRIFEAFEQVRGSNRRPPGLGLGLTISRSLAEALGGTLSAASSGPGQGSTFTLRLPTIGRPAPLARPPTPTVVPSPPPPPPLRILLVEDNEDTLKYLAQILTHRGHRVSTADRLSVALEAAAAGEFDLVMSDIELPDGSGLDLMRSLARRGVPGIAISGYGAKEDIDQSLAAGFAEHLTKPIDLRQLEETIRRVIARAE